MIRLLLMVREVWGARWGVLRWCVAGFVLWAAAADAGARAERAALAAMPDFDAAGEVAKLREAGRYGEAVTLADGVLAGGASGAARIRAERERAVAEQGSFVRRAKDVGLGALTGGAGVEPGRLSVEMLVGAIGTDMLVVGDVRDLAIQGWRWMEGEEADPVIVALSAIGIATTLAPEIDWAPSVLKVARKLGTIGEKLGAFIVRAARGRRYGELEKLLSDAAEISKCSSPGNAVRLLRLAEGPEDVARIARFFGREGKQGAAALHVTGDAGAGALRAADELRAVGRVEEAARLEGLVVKAAGKGERGAEWLRAGKYRALVRVHPLVGVLKGVYKGHASALVQRALEMMGAHALWVVPLVVGWFVLETWMLWRRGVGARRGEAQGGSTTAPDIAHPGRVTRGPRA
jgi:hypothetical protein